MTDRDDMPRSVSVSHIDAGRWLLTNVLWCPSRDLRGQPETGVRFNRAGKFEDFSLIQHGWWNFGMATVVILNRLGRGWDCGRIADFMNWCRDNRRWPFPSAKARTA